MKIPPSTPLQAKLEGKREAFNLALQLLTKIIDNPPEGLDDREIQTVVEKRAVTFKRAAVDLVEAIIAPALRSS